MDPELAARLGPRPEFEYSPDLVPLVRQRAAARIAARPPLPSDGRVEVSTVDVSEALSVRVYAPRDQVADSALLWIHGGGWTFGEPRTEDPMCHRFAAELGIPVVSPDYRLAPEHPHPAALDDCYATLTWLTSGVLGVHPERVTVAGGSAGGTLAAALCLLARDRGGPKINAQFLVYPAIDDRAEADDENGPIRRSDVGWFWSNYLSGVDTVTGYAAPGRAESLAGLPPAYIFITSADPLREEAWAYASRLMDDHVDTRVRFRPGGFHGFDYDAPEAAISRDTVAGWIHVLREIAL